jgi:hypothetical protein
VRQSSSPATRTFLRCFAGLAIVSLVGLTSCSSDSKSSSTTASPTEASPAPEDVKVAPAVVTAGMTKLPATIAAAIAAIGTADVDAKVSAIESEWASFEGTVRDTDQDLYLAIEDQLDPLQEQIRTGDTATATATAAKMSDLFGQYMTKHPG